MDRNSLGNQEVSPRRDMLRWAGSGIAMANAHPLVIDAADGLAAANDDDGVAAHLEALFG